jgi:hypothetical protein
VHWNISMFKSQVALYFGQLRERSSSSSYLLILSSIAVAANRGLGSVKNSPPPMFHADDRGENHPWILDGTFLACTLYSQREGPKERRRGHSSRNCWGWGAIQLILLPDSPATAVGHDAAGTPSSRWAPALSLHRFLRSSNAKGETFFYGFRISEFFIWVYFFLCPSVILQRFHFVASTRCCPIAESENESGSALSREGLAKLVNLDLPTCLQ